MPLSAATHRWLIRYALCVSLLAGSLVLFPLLVLAVTFSSEALPLVLPRSLKNLLFFWPQYFLLPAGIEDRATGVHHWAGVSTVVSVTMWLLLLGGYAWLTRRARTAYVLLGLLPTAAVLLQLILAVALRLAGFSPVLDGL
jgi:hypothetical protein